MGSLGKQILQLIRTNISLQDKTEQQQQNFKKLPCNSSIRNEFPNRISSSII